MMGTQPRGVSGLERAVTTLLATTSEYLGRVGIRSVVARDAVGALLWAVATALLLYPIFGPLSDFLGLGTSTAMTVFIIGVVTAQTLLLTIRRVLPVLCLVLVSVVQVVLVTGLPSDMSIYGPAGVVAAYTVGTLLPPRRLLWTVGTILVLQATAIAVSGSLFGGRLREALDPAGRALLVGPALQTPLDVVEPALAAIATIMTGVAAAATGAWVALRRDQITALKARAAVDAEERQMRASAAITAERSRMARELHDIAAHHLSGLVVQASAAERLVDTDPDSAKETIRSLRSQGRKTLDNLRSAVGVLRETGGLPERADDAGAPVPGLTVLDDLLQEARIAGDHVDLRVDGEPYDLPPIADVTAYRIIQESIVNARQHAAGAPVCVLITYSRETFRLEINNGPFSSHETPTDSGRTGFGILGMRERTALIGGSIDAGPTSDGGWHVIAQLPRTRSNEIGT